MRKGQITSYIILGILMLIGFVLVFSTTTRDKVVDVRTITYPDEVQPIAEFITQCVQTKGTQAVELALSQGGFVEIPPFIKYESNAHLTLDEYGLGILPYWSVAGEERIPPLDLTRSQLTKYVQEQTLECFDSFSAFSEEYEVFPQGDLVIDTNIGEQNVVFQAAYPIKIIYKATNQEFIIEKYVSFIPIRYKKLYELAKKVMQYENKNSVIENVTMTMVLSDPDIPTNGMLIDCGGKTWRLTDIKKRLQDHMTTALQTLRIKNTDHPPFAMDRTVYEGLRKSKRGGFVKESKGVPINELDCTLPPVPPGKSRTPLLDFILGEDKIELEELRKKV